MLAPLFTKTGVMPLRFQQVQLALGYLSYISQLSLHHYTAATLQESLSMLRLLHPCWLGDLKWVLEHLPGSHSLTLTEQHLHHPDLLDKQQHSIASAADEYLHSCITPAL